MIPTIKDIAKIAEVSPTAVSLALNSRNRSRVSEETRKKILRIAEELNYQPNFIARSLVSKKSHTIGLIITTIRNPFYPELAKGIEDKALEFGYNIILCSTNYDLRLEKYYINVLRNRRVDGIILASVTADDPNIKVLVEDNFPLILAVRRTVGDSLRRMVDYIVVDNFKGGYTAMEHLYRLGHRRIGIISGPRDASTSIERTEGAIKLLKDQGLRVDSKLILKGNYSKEFAYHAANKFLSLKTPPTAIFAIGDYMALGARNAILDSGLKIPEHIAMVGFDDIEICSLRGIDLTTIGTKKYEMGALAVKILVDKIEKRVSKMDNQIVLEPELIIRESCGYRLHGYNTTPTVSHSEEQSDEESRSCLAPC